MDKKTFTIGILIGIIALLCFVGYYHVNHEEVRRDTTKVHVTVYDTITYYAPKYMDSTIINYTIKTLPLAKDTVSGAATDTTSDESDSVSVVLPITQKVYSDTLYTAYVSGYEPSLDSIFIREKTNTETIYITETRTKTKDYPLGIGLTAGAGYGFIHKQPDVFVGVSLYYRIYPKRKRVKK